MSYGEGMALLRHCLGFQPLVSVIESCHRKFMDKLLENDAFNVLVKVCVNNLAPQHYQSLLQLYVVFLCFVCVCSIAVLLQK